MQFVGVLKVLIYEHAWEGNLQDNPPEGVINKHSGAEYKESRAER